MTLVWVILGLVCAGVAFVAYCCAALSSRITRQEESGADDGA